MSPNIFINYRTEQDHSSAGLIDQYLCDRFGDEHVFFASRSIRAGERYPGRLISGVRQSRVMLSVVGEGWSRHAALRDENDWVRREILEALEREIPLIPVLVGRKTDRLSPARLPPEFDGLATSQYVRLDIRTKEADLKNIGDRLAALLPSLRSADRTARKPPDADGTHNSSETAHDMLVQGRDISGGVSRTVIGDVRGNVHSGDGNMHIISHQPYNSHTYSPEMSGQGGTFIAGDQHGDIRHDFRDSRRDNEYPGNTGNTEKDR